MYLSLILVLIFKHYRKTLSTKKMLDNSDSVNKMENFIQNRNTE